QRQREFGIRVAMGASRGAIRGMVLRQGLGLVACGHPLRDLPLWVTSACGIPIGILLSWFTSRSAAALLLNVRTSDPLVLAGVAALLTLTSLAAMLGPARRAAGVEPLVALRAD